MRRAAAAIIAAVASAQPRALQPHWLALLPRAPPVAARAHVASTLADVLLFDPQAQVSAFHSAHNDLSCMVPLILVHSTLTRDLQCM